LRLKLELDEDAAARLVEQAAVERRPVTWQAEVLLRKALGLPFPYSRKSGHDHRVDKGLTSGTTGAGH
jgi:hypothetical protein